MTDHTREYHGLSRGPLAYAECTSGAPLCVCVDFRDQSHRRLTIAAPFSIDRSKRMTIHWASSFYDLQDRLIAHYRAPLHPHHHKLTRRVTEYQGRTGRLLELGAGGGQFAVAAALAGHDVTTVELLASSSGYIERLAHEHAVTVRAIHGDFYVTDPGGPFDSICYWDGFGIGGDEDQRALLRRLPGWLSSGGHVFIDVYTPWYWAQHKGFTRHGEGYVQEYGFDAYTCTLTDTYTPEGEAPQTQRLRCYSPADLRLLLEGTGLELQAIWPGGRFDAASGIWHPEVPLEACMSFTAVLRC